MTTQDDLVQVKRELEDLRNDSGLINPRDVVEAARYPTSALHRYFTWDEEEAAELCRLQEATALLRRLKIKVEKVDPITKKVEVQIQRAYWSAPGDRHSEGGYIPLEALLKDPLRRNELINRVIVELQGYQKRYNDLTELDAVWKVIGSLMPIKPKEPTPPRRPKKPGSGSPAQPSA